MVSNLSLADRDRLLIFISLFDSLIILFLYSSNKDNSLLSGKYLEVLDLFFEKFVKKNLRFYLQLSES